jgi:hypothetical protein
MALFSPSPIIACAYALRAISLPESIPCFPKIRLHLLWQKKSGFDF